MQGLKKLRISRFKLSDDIFQGGQLAQSEEHATLDLGVVSLSPVLGVDII